MTRLCLWTMSILAPLALTSAADAAPVLTTLLSFTGKNGDGPNGRLLADARGNLYGTTAYGGSSYSSSASPGYGTVFKLSPPAAGQSQWNETVLFSFTGKNGDYPYLGGLIADAKGNLYGTTVYGGSSYSSSASPGYGTVFKLSPPAGGQSQWTETVLFSFTGKNGDFPLGGLNATANGNLYGTTFFGGSSYSSSASRGYGTVFKLSPPAAGQSQWTETVLASFTGKNGVYPIAGLMADAGGNLFGTTLGGGSSYVSTTDLGLGTVFKLSAPASGQSQWTETVLFSFTGKNGVGPDTSLLTDASGNLYGTTYLGGASYSSSSSPGYGTVFKLSPPTQAQSQWTETVLASFAGKNGLRPIADLITDAGGSLVGTTYQGGASYSSSSSAGYGTIFKLTP